MNVLISKAQFWAYDEYLRPLEVVSDGCYWKAVLDDASSRVIVTSASKPVTLDCDGETIDSFLPSACRTSKTMHLPVLV
jgi:hypothetical protein